MRNGPVAWQREVDLIAVGSSSGGLLGAIRGKDLGLRTLVLEKADTLGGGTALSGGVVWIPCNHHMAEMGVSDSREEALSFLRAISLGRGDEEKMAAFLDAGPEMVRYVERHTPLKFVARPPQPDYYADLPSGKSAGRSIRPDVQALDPLLAEREQRQPILRAVRRSPVSQPSGPSRVPLTAGRALIAALVAACVDRGIEILMETRVRELIVSDGRVIGLRADRQGRDFFVKATRGVLLAAGGYEWNEAMNKRFLPAPDVHPHTSPSNEGDGHLMGMEVGAALANMDTSVWTPSIHVPGETIDGKPFYRGVTAMVGRPGSIIVDREGRRCCNESFYPDIGRALCAYDIVQAVYRHAPMYWLADQAFRDKYPVGPLPAGSAGAPWLHSAPTISGLAEQIGVPTENLVRTVERFNGFAVQGKDLDFHRGEHIYDHWRGEPEQRPNPCLRPLAKPPFYAVQLHAGTAGHRGGLVTDACGRVLNVRGEVIPCLYAAGNTAAQLVVGAGYTSGLCHAQSMVFGYLAAQRMANHGVGPVSEEKR